jgi:predicted ester cyclase
VTYRADIVNRYVAYLDACTRHAWDELPPFLAESVLVNGLERTRSEYVADLVATVEVFPDYSWSLRRALVDGQWLAVHLAARETRTGEFL